MMCTGYLHSYPFLRSEFFFIIIFIFHNYVDVSYSQGGVEDEMQEPVLPTRALQGDETILVMNMVTSVDNGDQTYLSNIHDFNY